MKNIGITLAFVLTVALGLALAYLGGIIFAVGAMLVIAFLLMLLHAAAQELWHWFVRWLARRLMAYGANHRPSLIVGEQSNEYLLRWELWRPFGCQVALHNIRRSDDDRAKHDHVGWHWSLILSGEYIEHFDEGSFWRKRGHIIFRPAAKLHRLELPVQNGGISYAWTLWVRGPKVREWGFLTREGWMDWKTYGKKYGTKP